MSYFIYQLLSTLAVAIAAPLVPLLFLLGKRFSQGLGERFGFYARRVTEALGDSRPVWIHAASVGEVDAASRLSRALKARLPGCKIVISTFTATGHLRAMQVASADAVVFLPLDQLWIVRRALARLNPLLLIFLETEIWPNLLRQAYRKGIPTLLLSGRLSARAFRRYARFRFFFRRVVQCYSAIGMQSADDAERMRALGAESARVFIVGNLKRAPGEKTPSDRAAGSEGLPRPREDAQVLVAGSSHRGEEELLLDVFRELQRSFPRLQMVLAPRHPQRFAEVEKLLRDGRLNFIRQSRRDGRPIFEEDVLLLDTVGDLQSFYGIGDVAFVGGSLVDAGGHNLLEPARLRKPVLFGPFMENFRSLAEEMKRNGGGFQVGSRDDLAREIGRLLRDPGELKAAGERAYRVAAGDSSVLKQNIALAERYLEGEAARYGALPGPP